MLRYSTARKIPPKSPQNDRNVARASSSVFSITTRKIAARESGAKEGGLVMDKALEKNACGHSGKDEGKPLARSRDQKRAKHQAARRPKGDRIVGSKEEPGAEEATGQVGDKEE